MSEQVERVYEPKHAGAEVAGPQAYEPKHAK